MKEMELQISKYKNELEQLHTQKRELENQILIQEDRLKQLKENLETEYGTSDEEELLKIKVNLEKEINELLSKISPDA